MQTFALLFAIILLSVGALLNTAVLAYFVLRTWRATSAHRARQGILLQSLTATHR